MGISRCNFRFKGIRMDISARFKKIFGFKSRQTNDEITLLNVIKEYQITADLVVNIFKQKYGVENILEAWHQRVYTQTGKLKEFGIKFYAFHGIGIAVKFSKKFIDLDFAELPELRHDGFDLWRLTSFIEGQPQKFAKYLDKTLLKNDFEKLISEGTIRQPQSDYYTTLYFLSSSLQ
jgi:hypothetical protein